MTTVLAWAKSIGYEFDTPRAEAAFVREVSEVGKNEGISQLLHNLVVNLKTPQNAQDTIDTIRLNKIRNCIASIDASDNLPVDDPQLLQKGSELEQQGTAIQAEIDRLEKELLNEQQDMIEIKTNISEIRQRCLLFSAGTKKINQIINNFEQFLIIFKDLLTEESEQQRQQQIECDQVIQIQCNQLSYLIQQDIEVIEGNEQTYTISNKGSKMNQIEPIQINLNDAYHKYKGNVVQSLIGLTLEATENIKQIIKDLKNEQNDNSISNSQQQINNHNSDRIVHEMLYQLQREHVRTFIEENRIKNEIERLKNECHMIAQEINPINNNQEQTLNSSQSLGQGITEEDQFSQNSILATLQIIHQCDQQANITEQELIGELVSHIEDGLNAVEQLETTFNKIAHTETQSARKRDIIMDSLGKGNFELVQTLAKMVDEANEITKETWWRRKENVQQQSQTQQCIVDNILSEINQSIKEKDCSKAFSEFFFGNNEEMESEQEDDLVGQKQEKNDGEQISISLSRVNNNSSYQQLSQIRDEILNSLSLQPTQIQSTQTSQHSYNQHHVLSSVSSFDILPRITEQMKDEVQRLQQECERVNEIMKQQVTSYKQQSSLQVDHINDLTNLISQQDDLQSERWVDEIEGVRKNAFQAVKYYDKLIKSINDWWNQPAQYALDSFRVDDLPLESWTQKWKQLSLELIRLINPARVGTSDLNQ